MPPLTPNVVLVSIMLVLLKCARLICSKTWHFKALNNRRKPSINQWLIARAESHKDLQVMVELNVTYSSTVEENSDAVGLGNQPLKL